MELDWNAIAVAAVGVFGYAFKAIVDIFRERYAKAKEIKARQESKEDRLRRLVYEWREHAYLVRRIAIDAGVTEDELPEKPDENDA